MALREDGGIPDALLDPCAAVHWEHVLSANPMARVVNGLDGNSPIFESVFRKILSRLHSSICIYIYIYMCVCLVLEVTPY